MISPPALRVSNWRDMESWVLLGSLWFTRSHNTVVPPSRQLLSYILFQHPNLGFHFLLPAFPCPPISSLLSCLPSLLPLLIDLPDYVFQKHDFLCSSISIYPPSQQVCTECQLCAKHFGLRYNKIYIAVGQIDIWQITTALG